MKQKIIIAVWMTVGIFFGYHHWTKKLDLEVRDAVLIIPVSAAMGPGMIIIELLDCFDDSKIGKTVILKQRTTDE